MKTRTQMLGMGAAILFLGMATESLLAQSKDRFDREERSRREQAIPRMEPKQRVDQRSEDRVNRPAQNTQKDNRNSDRGAGNQSQDRGGNDTHHENKRNDNQEGEGQELIELLPSTMATPENSLMLKNEKNIKQKLLNEALKTLDIREKEIIIICWR